jgi:hypothetical protein
VTFWSLEKLLNQGCQSTTTSANLGLKQHRIELGKKCCKILNTSKKPKLLTPARGMAMEAQFRWPGTCRRAQAVEMEVDTTY